MALGEKIRMLRKQRDWTQNELAKKLGVHPQDLTRWERNKMKPRPNTIAKLAEVLQVSVEELTTDGTGGATLPISDPELLVQFQAAEQLGEDQRKALKTILQALITQQQVKNLARGEAS